MTSREGKIDNVERIVLRLESDFSSPEVEGSVEGVPLFPLAKTIFTVNLSRRPSAGVALLLSLVISLPRLC